MQDRIADIVDLDSHPLGDTEYRRLCRQKLDRRGVLVLEGFLNPQAIESIRREGDAQKHLAYYTNNRHNVYLTPSDPAFDDDHPRNREIVSTKGCITTDQVPDASPLKALYDAEMFRSFLCEVLGEEALHEYADPLSSINLHYADPGQELGWHFDNSSFAITLLIQEPEAGGDFQYVRDVRDADAGEMNYDNVAKVLNGEINPDTLAMAAGDLVLFRGRNAMHRVTPTEGERTRMLVVLAYNSAPGIALSESARMTFFGRLG